MFFLVGQFKSLFCKMFEDKTSYGCGKYENKSPQPFPALFDPILVGLTLVNTRCSTTVQLAMSCLKSQFEEKIEGYTI